MIHNRVTSETGPIGKKRGKHNAISIKAGMTTTVFSEFTDFVMISYIGLDSTRFCGAERKSFYFFASLLTFYGSVSEVCADQGL